jgi:hypothetical protein
MIMLSFFEQLIYILGLISPIFGGYNCNRYYLDEKELQNIIFLMNLIEIFFPYYIVCLEMLFSVILYLLEHFKVTYATATKKSFGSAFLKEQFIYF